MHIVINKTTRPLIFAKPIGTDLARNGAVNFESVRLLPGSNEIDDEAAKSMATSATVKTWAAKGFIEAPTPTKPDAEGLSGYDAPMAMQLISDCYDAAILDRWLDAEKRKDVRRAITARQRELVTALSKDRE